MVINYIIFFMGDVFIYLCLFNITYIPPTLYVIYGEYHVLTKN